MQSQTQTQLFTEKYFPPAKEQFIGNSDILEQTFKWAEQWQKGKQQKPLLLHGQTGSGKTCLAHLLARLFNWSIFEMNASDLRTKESIERIAGGAAMNASFDGRLRLILLDEVDGLQRVDKGGAGAIAAIAKSATQPMILTANDVWGEKKLLPLRSSCTLLEFKKINYLSIAKRLKEICAAEAIPFDEEAVKELAKNCSGDMRSALLDLQTLCVKGSISIEDVNSLGHRERTEKIFKTMEAIFKGKTFSEIRSARMQTEIDNDLLLRWVEENIPRIYVEGNDTPLAFEKLSRADIYNGWIMRRQNYVFLRYSTEMMTSGMALSREHDYHGWLRFQFPTLLSKLSKSSAERTLKKSMAKKIGKQLHSSTSVVLSKDFPFYRQFLDNPEQLTKFSAQFELDEDEIAYLLDSDPETKKVKTIYENSQKLRQQHIRPIFIKQGSISDETANGAEKPKPQMGQTSLGTHFR